jgi:hypothetical protein
MRSLDPAVDSLMKIWLNESTLEQNHYCRAKIIAHGVPTSRIRSSGKHKDCLQPCLGWASTDHADSNDVLKPEVKKKLVNNLEAWVPKPSSPGFKQESAVKEYLLKFGSWLHFGVPTCCGYEYLGMEADGSTILNHRNIFLLKSAIIHHYTLL